MVQTPQASSPEEFSPEDIAGELSAFKALSTDDKLGLLWEIYKKMGDSITPAAPGAAEPQFTEKLYEAVKGMDNDAQLNFMRDLCNKASTEHTKTYGSFDANNKLYFWYHLSEGMDAGEIVPVPDDYELPSGASELLTKIEQMDFNQQITLLRQSVIDMGAQ